MGLGNLSLVQSTKAKILTNLQIIWKRSVHHQAENVTSFPPCPGKLLAFPGLPLGHLGTCQVGQMGEPPNRAHSHGDLPTVVPDFTSRSPSWRSKCLVLSEKLTGFVFASKYIKIYGQNLRFFWSDRWVVFLRIFCRPPVPPAGGLVGEQAGVERRGRWGCEDTSAY